MKRRSTRQARQHVQPAQHDKSTITSEGDWRGPFFGMGELNGSYKINPLGDGWQNNLSFDTRLGRQVAAPYSCVMLNARAVSQCKMRHMRNLSGGGFQEVDKSRVTEMSREPNSYETWTQLIYNTVSDMLFDGAALWVSPPDNPEIVHRIPYGSWSTQIEPETRELFYAVGGGNDLVPNYEFAIPARYVAHFRMYTPRHPLIGESPLRAAALAVGINVKLSQSQLAFFTNMNRPSGVMTTDQNLNRKQIKELREAFEDQAQSWAAGGVPILAGGLQFKAAGIAQNDAQLIEQQKMSLADVCRVYGIPIALLGDTSGPQGGTSALIAHWLSIGLGSLIESIERTLDRFFQLPHGERVELDPTPLLRVDFAGRIEGLTKSIQGGLLTPDEARRREGYGPVPGGKNAFLQRQMTPIDSLIQISQADATAAVQAATNPPAPPTAPAPPPKGFDAASIVKSYLASARTAQGASTPDPAALRERVAGMITSSRRAT